MRESEDSGEQCDLPPATLSTAVTPTIKSRKTTTTSTSREKHVANTHERKEEISQGLGGGGKVAQNHDKSVKTGNHHYHLRQPCTAKISLHGCFSQIRIHLNCLQMRNCQTEEAAENQAKETMLKQTLLLEKGAKGKSGARGIKLIKPLQLHLSNTVRCHESQVSSRP